LIVEINSLELIGLSTLSGMHSEAYPEMASVLQRFVASVQDALGSNFLGAYLVDNRWHVRWIFRERGITIIGPDPKTLLHPVPTGALRSEAVAAIQELKSRFVAEIDLPLGWFNTRFGQPFRGANLLPNASDMCKGHVQSNLSGVK
jgi:hypothetical protein